MLIISPFSNTLPTGELSPKNWPIENWNALLAEIKKEFHWLHIIQIGTHNEKQLKNTDLILRNLSFEKLAPLVRDCQFFISVDNFFPHFAKHYNKKGIVIFGPSNPIHFGYEENINLFKSEQKFRKNQFWFWTQCEDCFQNNFPTVETVMQNVRKILNK